MYIVIYDFGTSSVKTCLFQIDSEIRLVASASAGYGLYAPDMENKAVYERNYRVFKRLYKDNALSFRRLNG